MCMSVCNTQYKIIDIKHYMKRFILLLQKCVPLLKQSLFSFAASSLDLIQAVISSQPPSFRRFVYNCLFYF